MSEVEVELRRPRAITGTCVDVQGEPLAGCWVQAISSHDERPLSELATTGAVGAFTLHVNPEAAPFRVRAVRARGGANPLPLCDTEAAIGPIEEDTTIGGVVPGGEPIVVRLGHAPLVILDVTADVPFHHLQVEGLVWDEEAGAWGRLGGPSYRRDAATRRRNPTTSPDDAKRGFAALPRSDADRPLKVWSWQATYTVVDPRGRDRVEVKLPSRREISVGGRGWKAGDRIRVIARFGAPGAEMPVIWIDGDDVTGRDAWSRGDAPAAEFEFQLLREGRVIGRSERVPAGTANAKRVRIDVGEPGAGPPK